MTFSFSPFQRFKKCFDYKKRGIFKTVYDGKLTRVEVWANHFSFSRLGITVTKRFGKAVRRNHFKRIVREAFRLLGPGLQKGLDILVKPLKVSKKTKLKEIMEDIQRAVDKGERKIIGIERSE